MTAIEKIEAFFGAPFLVLGDPPDDETPHGEISCFDGFVYWCLTLSVRDQYLWITANDQNSQMPHPVVELYVYFGEVSLEETVPGRHILQLYPPNTEPGDYFLRFSKAGGERISFSTVFGDPPKPGQNDAAST